MFQKSQKYIFSLDFICRTTILFATQHGMVPVLFKNLIMSKTSGKGYRICMYMPQQVGSKKLVTTSKHITDTPRIKIFLLLFHNRDLTTILDSHTSRNITHHNISVKLFSGWQKTPKFIFSFLKCFLHNSGFCRISTFNFCSVFPHGLIFVQGILNRICYKQQ